MNGDWLELATTIIPSILTAVSAMASVVINYTDHPDDRYRSKVKDLRKNRWGEVAGALGEVIVEVITEADDSDDDEINDQPTDEAMYALVLQKKYNSELLEDVEMEVEEYEEPFRCYRTCRRSREKLSDRVLLGLLGGVASLVFAFLGTPLATIFVGLTSGLALGALVSAANHFRIYRKARTNLDEMWEQYNFVEDI